jgi:hypothetical protein
MSMIECSIRRNDATITIERGWDTTANALIQEARDRQQRRRRWTVALLLMLAVTAWAGSRAGDPARGDASRSSEMQVRPSAASLPEACTLLTSSQVAKVMSGKVEYHVPQNSQLQHGCTWNLAPVGTFTYAHASVSLIIGVATKAQFNQQRRLRRGAVTVHGLGQEAFWSADSPVHLLSVWQNGRMIEISTSEATSPLEADRQLAKLVLKRL